MASTGYAGPFLKRYGQVCTIQRTPSVTSRLTLKQVSRSADPSTRDAVHEGLILASSVLVSGEFFAVNGGTYLTQSTQPDPVHGEMLWYAVKCNATVEHKRQTETVDAGGNRVLTWSLLATTAAWGQIVTARLRETDPGLLDSARYVFQLPKALGLVELDRLVYGGTNYRVESVDDIAMAGVVRVQLGVDTR